MGVHTYWLTRGLLFLMGVGYIGAWAVFTMSPLVIDWEPPDLLYAAAVLVLMGAISLVSIIVADVAGEISGPDQH